jgi:hypothetical protein
MTALNDSVPKLAPLALVRLFVRETVEHATTLIRYFQRAGHPFVVRGTDEVPEPVRAHCRRGQVFELFTLPIDLGEILEALDRDGIHRDLDMVFDLSDLPLLIVNRKGPPAEPLHPEREFRRILDLLPTWHPDGPAKVVASAQTAAQPSRRAPLQAPFAALTHDDADTVPSFGRSSASIG